MYEWTNACAGIKVEFTLEPGNTGLKIMSQDGQTRSGGTATVTLSPATAPGKAVLTVSSYHAVSQAFVIEVVEEM